MRIYRLYRLIDYIVFCGHVEDEDVDMLKHMGMLRIFTAAVSRLVVRFALARF